MSYVGDTPGWQAHFAARDTDADHDVKLASLETKDGEIESKIGHVEKTVVEQTGYNYTTDCFNDGTLRITWTGSTIKIRHDLSSSRYVTRTFTGPLYNQTTTSYMNPGSEYWLNFSYDDSSYHATSYGTFTVHLQDRDYNSFCYSIAVIHDYYHTKIVVTRLK